MNDARLGIVHLPLPDGREVALQLTFARLDARGHTWFIDQLGALSKGKTGSTTARAELLEAFSDGVISAEDVQTAPASAYPIADTMRAVWAAWEIAQYGPDGRPAADGAANPPQRRPTWWATAFGRLFGRG